MREWMAAAFLKGNKALVGINIRKLEFKVTIPNPFSS